jgi:O-antigen/teichoic acid export membrane protein
MPIQHAMQTLRLKFQTLRRAEFMRSVGILIGGTAFAQLLTVLVLPLITRLYSPADFSVLAVYASILTIVSVVACLRLEIAIPMPESDEDAANLLALALCSCTAVAALVALAILCLPDQIVGLLAQPGLRLYLWLLPLGIWLASAYAAVQFWATRKKRFSTIAKTRMTQAIGGAGVQLGFGWFAALGPLGLLLGQAITSGAGLFGLGRAALKEDSAALRSISRTNMHRVFRAYDRFPKYSTFEAFANNAAIHLPVIIIAAMTVGPEAGYLLLATRAMGMPIGLIGGAVSQVYLSRAPNEMRAGRLAAFTAQTIGGLAKSGVGPLIFIGIVSPVMFSLVFGVGWQRAGELVAWMTPWFILQFLSSPVSMILHVAGKQRAALDLQVFGLLLRVGAVSVVGWLAPQYIVEVYAISGLIFYFLYLLVVAQVSEIEARALMHEIKKCLGPCLAWILGGIFFALVLNYLK